MEQLLLERYLRVRIILTDLTLNQESCDLVKAGIVDPTKVVRTALIDAVSVAALLTTTKQ